MSRVLLIEDEPWMGELYAQLLGRHHEVTWLRDGYAAMEAIDAARPDVIVLDLMLPWVSGLQLMHELVSYEDAARIPIVLFSAVLPEDLDAAVLQAYGVVAALDKTAVKPAEVVATVNDTVRTHANTTH